MAFGHPFGFLLSFSCYDSVYLENFIYMYIYVLIEYKCIFTYVFRIYTWNSRIPEV